MIKETNVDGNHVKYPAVKEAFEKAEIALVDGKTHRTSIIWWDGDIKKKDFENVGCSQRINKIPGMDYICFKSTTIHSLNQMRRLYPNYYNFFPHSFLLPHQFSDLQRAHNHLQGYTNKPVTWIVKPRNGCCGNGIKLVQHLYELSHRTDSLVVQRYIQPFLLDGYKFDFRFYILISTLAPYTAYIYKEGLARFCTHEYKPPTSSTLDDKYSHLTNTSINKENLESKDKEFTKLASVVLAQISEKNSSKGSGLWKKICEVAMFSILSIWPSIVSSLTDLNSEIRIFGRRPPEKSDRSLDTFSKYFHIMGIDVMISESGKPVVLELNDRPSMIVTYECERELKKNMIFDAFSHISIDGSPLDPQNSNQDGKKEVPNPDNWVKILPCPEGDPLEPVVREMISKTASVFRTYAANRERPHYEVRYKSSPKGKTSTFADLEAQLDCQ